LALQCEKLGTFRLSVLSIHSLNEAFHPTYQRLSSNVAHGAQTPFRARYKLHNAPAHQRFRVQRTHAALRTAAAKCLPGFRPLPLTSYRHAEAGRAAAAL